MVFNLSDIIKECGKGYYYPRDSYYTVIKIIEYRIFASLEINPDGLYFLEKTSQLVTNIFQKELK